MVILISYLHEECPIGGYPLRVAASSAKTIRNSNSTGICIDYIFPVLGKSLHFSHSGNYETSISNQRDALRNFDERAG
jgi:hypothetical protein